MKKEAQACGPRHRAASGTKVRVKLSVEGKTGRVIQSAAEGEHHDSPLGHCVATAFAKAQFPPFRTARFGLLYTLRTE